MAGRLQEHTDALCPARRYRSVARMFDPLSWQEPWLRRAQRWLDGHKRAQAHDLVLYTGYGWEHRTLTAEIDLQACRGDFCLALGFGETPPEADRRARAMLLDKSDCVIRRYVDDWERVQNSCLDLGEAQQNGFDPYRVSTAVLRTHESKRFPGGMIASLSRFRRSSCCVRSFCRCCARCAASGSCGEH